jgi:hypothetical protein
MADVVAKWSESVKSWSVAMNQQQHELIAWSERWAEGLCDSGKALSRLARLNHEMSAALQESSLEWVRLAAAGQEYLGVQLQKGEELLCSKSMPEAQSAIAALSEATQRFWRLSAHSAVRAGARLMPPMEEE